MSLYIVPFDLDDVLPTSQHRCHRRRRTCQRPSDLWMTPTECKFLNSENSAGYLRSTLSNLEELEKQTKVGKDGFQVCLDVKHFQPNEISVKIVENAVVVEANHEERKDSHGYISRRFTRRYELPEEFKSKDVVSSISSDGILSIKCPKTEPAIEGNVRHIQIQQTGPARLNVGNKEDQNSVQNQQLPK